MEYRSLISEYKTPFYFYDIPELKKRVDMISEHQDDIGLCYAMKAAPLLAKYIAPFIDRLEVCSPGEYEICIRDGVSPEKILVSGVNKTRESMKRILSLGGAAGLFTIESREQFEILEEVSKEYSSKLRVYIRLSSGNQFGVDKATFEELAEKVINSSNTKLVGIHYFSGTQKSLKKIEKELSDLSEYGVLLRNLFGRDFSLEYGPGLSIDYFASDKESEDNPKELFKYNESFMEELMEVVERTGIRNSYSDITFEYGRYIAATCGKYFTGVVDVKTTEETNFAILEGGLHQISYFGSMAGMKVPPIEFISGKDTFSADETAENLKDYVLAGSLCSVNDILVRKMSLPTLCNGDTLCFNLAGAYCATEGISLFLSRDLPAIVIRDTDGSTKLVRDHIETNNLNGGF